ncbi:hypothetical protein [Rhodococcus rhodochrous]|uniref:hypothetical protein n=1 Tax=Rhodococcus rhodochrous TaxID=1829 RepID=UPI001786AE46|nr:hypothetical protein [Rhodococcus rhodochrous]QOH55259.1 hypothetical protein C6Y44_04190 [Rhodococcus rhodochrous]
MSATSASPFIVPKSGAENPDNYFTFQIEEDGPTYRLPFLQYLPGPAVELLEHPGNRGSYGFVKELIRRVDPKVAAAISAAKLTRPQLLGTFRTEKTGEKDKDGNDIEKDVVVEHGIHSMWVEASKVSEGESSASDAS